MQSTIASKKLPLEIMFISKSFLILFICMLAACGNSISQTENSNQSPQKEKTQLFLKMEKSGCYGRCPSYDLTVELGEKVMFEGKAYTETTGKAEDKLSAEQLKNLTSEIEKADFFSLENAYDYDSGNCPELATDMPSVKLTIRLNGKEKTINHYHGCFEKDNSPTIKSNNVADKIFPQQLYILENRINEIIGTKRWIGERK